MSSPDFAFYVKSRGRVTGQVSFIGLTDEGSAITLALCLASRFDDVAVLPARRIAGVLS